MLIFHQLYRPEHHPNHPRPVVRNGVEVEVTFVVVYVERGCLIHSMPTGALQQ